MEQTKTCTVCNDTKDASRFSKDKRASDGLQSRCKACEKARYEANRDKTLARKKARNQTQRGKYSNYKGGAKTRGISFELTLDEFITFWGQDCHYCGDPIPTIGIDRIDSDVGYSLENCVSCCEMCNYMKLDHPIEQWLSHMAKVLRAQGATVDFTK